jgi:hypothetical protein
LGLTFALIFIFWLSPITFAPIDYSSHCSLILIQYFKNKNSKTEIYGLPTPFYLFLYIKIKREMRERQREKEERKKREKKIKIKI